NAAGRQVRQNVSTDLLCRAARVVAPIVGIDPVAYGDVAEILCELQGMDLVCGVGLFIDRIGRTKQGCFRSDKASKEALGQIQLEPHVARRNVADIGMGERMVPDGMAFLEDSLGQPRKLIGLNPNQEKSCLRLLSLENIQYFRRPFWIGT